MFGRTLEAHQCNCTVLDLDSRLADRGKRSLGSDMRSEDGAKRVHITSTRGIAAGLRIAKLLHVAICDASFLERRREYTLRKPGPSRLGKIADVEKQRHAYRLKRANKVRNARSLVSQGINLLQFRPLRVFRHTNPVPTRALARRGRFSNLPLGPACGLAR